MSVASKAPESFVFLAATATGGRKFGFRQASDARRLAEMLRRERLLVLRTWRLPAWASRDAGLGLKDAAAVNDQLAQLLTRGVPLTEALDVTAETVTKSSRAVVVRMRELVAQGSSFAAACAATGAFDAVTVAVYRAAERTGDLGGAARSLATSAKRQLAIRSKAITLMTYPAIVLTISLLVSIGMLTMVVPRIGAALINIGAEMNWYSRTVIGAGTMLRDNFLAAMLVVVVVLALGLVLNRVVRRALGALVRRLPLLREVVLAQECARFFAVMSAMARSGVPIADALGTANAAVAHPTLRAQLETLRSRLIEGGLLRVLIEEVKALPLATRRLLIAAERAGDLSEAFGSLSQDAADDLDRRSTRLMSALEPLLIVVMFVMIGSMLLAIMIPLLLGADVQ